MKELRLALLGFGNAGRAFAKLLLEKEEKIKERFGYGVYVTDRKSTRLNSSHTS